MLLNSSQGHNSKCCAKKRDLDNHSLYIFARMACEERTVVCLKANCKRVIHARLKLSTFRTPLTLRGERQPCPFNTANYTVIEVLQSLVFNPYQTHWLIIFQIYRKTSVSIRVTDCYGNAPPVQFKSKHLSHCVDTRH